MTKFRKFVPLTKVDEVQRLVYGRATEEVVDKANEILDYATSKPLFEKWSGDIAKTTANLTPDSLSLGNVRAMHGKVAAGKLTDIQFLDDERAIDVCAKIIDDQEWAKVTSGTYTGFSIGGDYAKTWADPTNKGVRRYTAAPAEISIVDNPCVGSATFAMVKASGMTESVEFKLWEPTNDEIAAKATAMAKAANDASKTFADYMDAAKDVLLKDRGMSMEEADEGQTPGVASEPRAQAVDAIAEVEEAEAALQTITAVGMPTPKRIDVPSLKVAGPEREAVLALAKAQQDSALGKIAELETVMAKADATEVELEPIAKAYNDLIDPPVDWGIDQVFKVKADGAVFATKAEAKKHVEGMRAVKALGPTSPLAAALDDVLNKAKGGEKPKGDYGEVKYADPGYQADKKPRYPIDTAAHIRAAWNYINKPKNADKYGDNAGKVKDAIVAAWKDKIDAAGPPSAEKMALFDNRGVVDLLKAVIDRRENLNKGLYTVSWVAGQLSSVGSILQEVCWEEQWEGDNDSKLPQMAMDAFAALRTLLVEMVSEECAELISALNPDGKMDQIALLESPEGEIMEMAAKAFDLIKVDTVLLEKVGRRNSASDQKKVQAVHDHAVSLGADCKGEKAASGDLAKVVAERDTMKQWVDDAMPKVEELGKLYASTVTELNETKARLIKLEAQPEPMPQVRLLSRSGMDGGGDLSPDQAFGKLVEMAGGLEGLQKMAMRAALSQSTITIGAPSGG